MNSSYLTASLMQSARMFAKEQIPFTLFHGTALHLYRGDDTFSDDDVDFLIPAEHFHRVKPMLIANQLEVVYETSYFLRIESLSKDGIGPVDMYKDLGDPQYVCDRQTELGYPRSMIEPYQRSYIVDNSAKVPIGMPAKIPEFLVANYGKDWRHRRPRWKPVSFESEAMLHWKNNCTMYIGKQEANQACKSTSPSLGVNPWCRASPPPPRHQHDHEMSKPAMCDFPLADRAAFTYAGRPWEDYLGRWAAMYGEMLTWVSESHRAKNNFSVIDLGSNAGFFSIQTAGTFPQAVVIGVEGSVGVGNGGGIDGSSGPNSNTCSGLRSSLGVQNHLKWIEKLDLANNFIAGEQWDFNRVQELANTGFTVDVMYMLSMFHWMDQYSRKQGQYPHGGAKSVKDDAYDTVNLMAQILSLANIHVIELPSFKDQPQYLSHLSKSFNGSEQEFLEAAMRQSGRSKVIQQIYVTSCGHPRCESWYAAAGVRRVFLIKDKDEVQAHDRQEILEHMKSKCVLPERSKEFTTRNGAPACSTL